MRSHEARPVTVPPKPELWGVNIAVPQPKLWEGQSLPGPSDLRHSLQVLHHFLPTGWLPYPWLSTSTPFILNVLLLAQRTQLGADSVHV